MAIVITRPEYSFYQGLCVESRVTRQNGTVEWIRDPAIKNEPWDLEVYNFALAILCGLNWMREPHFAELERRIKASLGIIPAIQVPTPPNQTATIPIISLSGHRAR